MLNWIRVPVPPIELPCEFAHRVTAVEAPTTAKRESLAELGTLFATPSYTAPSAGGV